MSCPKGKLNVINNLNPKSGFAWLFSQALPFIVEARGDPKPVFETCQIFLVSKVLEHLEPFLGF